MESLFPMDIERFTGGVLDTNGYLLTEAGCAVLVDAPQGVARWLAEREVQLDALWLTHSHFDHVLDAAVVSRAHGCPLYCHAAGAAMLRDPSLLRRFGFDLEFEAVEPDHLIGESDSLTLGGLRFSLLHVPGHSPDSLCFYLESEATLFGGDVLFAGGVGRWDLPGGDGPLLFQGIRNKLYPLPEAVRVWPGHGPSTTIGAEKSGNPYVRP